MPDDRPRVLALLKRFGWNATSFQILEPGFRYWFDGDDACVGYVDTGRAWVVAGPPIAATDAIADVSAHFVAAAAAEHRRVCCFGTETRFTEQTGWPALRVGDQPIWAPADWDEVVRGSRNLREQLRRARAKGVTVRVLDRAELAPEHPTRAQLDTLIARWLVPLAGDVTAWLRAARRLGRSLYDFDGLRAFKAKFKPRTWDPIFLSYPADRNSIGALADTLTAFARGGLLRFGLETFLRGPAIVVRALAPLLVVWTAR